MIRLGERNRTVSVRLSEKEKKHLKKQVDAAGLKMEPFIRKLIMGVEIHPRPPENVVMLLREINAIGNNINQIARKVNACDEVSRKELVEIHGLIDEIYNEVKR